MTDASLGQLPMWTPSQGECLFPTTMPGNDLFPDGASEPQHRPGASNPTPPPSREAENPGRDTESNHGTERVVSLLLQRGVNVNVQDSRGHTPLHIAAQHGHLGVVRLLLATEQIDVNARDHNGSTPLHMASEKGHVDVVQLLVAHGARLDLRSGRI
ncbi:ankyrin repeat-containing domain protein [Aspergillus alliaceus]|uniref:Ankyrin repeat-containing domain protein n=1 Tax=Petromyces alliaceus TaxID=209559 RepID=A0A5N7CGA9_PETAA|nr:ankyrin repeat-containing domain protein [Aspergillus alliaceus]